ncbi:rac guanine nucleotide exchange factor JJ isoform X2 [Copidosoma floridanum]|uniref:rac guanine nucleotide exchange factor JJ isoform X2 n=1 Tax=Copidosoma floridanum TaxID=29053 RepID=UPI0006C9DE8C|nr:rac guanine nucleotide exchange factor JJ isoform X2 [Copidosoma floridanum]XP_014219861.1 rac guanine nucleotide exchange factor JJ isoform X2 [Copidosoma floridanum]
MATATETPIVNEATEIRCQEKTKGGLRYEVILAEPTAPAKRAPSPTRPTSPTTMSPALVAEKLRAAEERRLSLEAEKMANLSARTAKIEEAARKRDELTSGFVNTTREILDKKLTSSEEKREAHYADKKKKIKDHLEGVEKSRQSKEHQNEEIRIAIEEKLKTAEAQREMNLKNKVERLKEHEDHVNRVRHLQIEQTQKLDTVIKTKLELAGERRKTIERETLDKIRKCSRVDAIKSNKSKSLGSGGNDEQPANQETASSG